MASGDSPTLFQLLERSELLPPEQLAELKTLPEAGDPDPRVLGRLLVQRGLLTKFQVTQLAQGKARALSVGAYLILEPIGEGGMGQVFKARHTAMKRLVALKLIRKDLLANPASVQRFYQEVQLAAQLHHPNIVLAYDAGPAGNTHYLAMEYAPGTDLARLVQQSGPLPAARAADFVRQAAMGLQHAHERGLIHRDIKPHNLLVTTAEGTGRPLVKLLDLGLARLSGQGDRETALTQSGALLGTPEYLAPEQALDSRKADIRSDVYSLGCTLYYLLTGQTPFGGETMTQVLLQHQMGQMRPLRELRPEVPPGLEEVVRRMLAKEPGERYQTPAEVVRALEPFAGGEGTLALEAWGNDAPARPAEKKGGATVALRTQAGAALDDGATTAEGSGKASRPPGPSRQRPHREAAGTGRKALLIGGVAGLLLIGVVGGGALMLSSREPQNSTPGPEEQTLAPRPAPPPELPAVPAGRPAVPAGDPAKPPAVPAGGPAAPAVEVPLSPPLAQRCSPLYAAFTPDGEIVLAPPAAGHVRWLSRRGGPPVPSIPGSPRSRLTAFGVDASGKHAFEIDSAGEATFYEREGNNPPRHLPLPVSRVAWALLSPDAGRLIVGEGPGPSRPGAAPAGRSAGSLIHVLDSKTGEELLRFEQHTGKVTAACLTPDGKRVVSCSAGGGFVWELASGQVVHRFVLPDGLVARSCLAAPDGNKVFCAVPARPGATARLLFWDLARDQQAQVFAQGFQDISCVAVSPDGLLVAIGIVLRSGAGGAPAYAVQVYDLSTGKVIRRVPRLPPVPVFAAFAPDSRELLFILAQGPLHVVGVPGP